ncbi:MAG: hypothetical protein AAB492_00870 [Patescibacteria group bacterium]
MKKRKTYGFLIGFAGVIAVSIVLLWPLFRHGFFITDDGDWMVIRLSAFYQSLADGQFPVRFLGRLYHNYGYPVSNFLYPGFLYVGSFFRFLGFSFVDVIKIIFAISIIGSGSFLYLALRKKYETLSSLGGAASFVLSPYVTFDVFTRGSVGEIFAFLPASMLLYGIMAHVYWIVPIATAVLILGHNSLALLFVAPLWLLVGLQPKPWVFIKGMIIGVGMATFFWLPALFERRFVIFDRVSVADTFTYFITVKNWWLLGVGVLAALYILFIRRAKFTAFERACAIIVLLASILSLPISAVLWSSVPSLSSFIQFPYRFLSVSTMIGAVGISAAMSLVQKKSRIYIFIIMLIALGGYTLFQQTKIRYSDRIEGYYSTNEGTTTVKNEYMPRWVQVIQTTRASKKVEVHSGDATYFSGKETPQYIDGIVEARSDSIVQINTIYYPGWGVTIDGKLTPIDYTNTHGVMRVNVSAGSRKLEASFRETGFRLITDIISFAFGVMYLVWIYTISRRS